MAKIRLKWLSRIVERMLFGTVVDLETAIHEYLRQSPMYDEQMVNFSIKVVGTRTHIFCNNKYTQELFEFENDFC